MIRVAQVVRPAAGGIRRHVSQLLVHLDTRAYASTLFAPPDFHCDPNPPDLRRFPVAIAARTAPLHDLRSIVNLSRQLRGRFELVHAHGLRGALIGVFAARLARIPAVFTAHNLVTAPDPLQKIALKGLGASAAKIIAVSNAVARSLVECGAPRERITVISNGIDLAPFDVLRSAEDSVAPYVPTIAAIGRLAPEKGFDVLIQAASILQQRMPEVRVILAGSGPEAQRLRDMVSNGTSVTFVGYVDDLVPLFQQADIVAVPSRQEGQGITALEAMAARKPVVASRVGGLVETIVEHQTGLLVPPDDPDALANALFSLLTNRELCLLMGAAGRRRVEAEYTLDRMIDRTAMLYNAVAAGGKTAD